MSFKLGENIAILRKEKGLTQEELAQVFHVTNQSVSKWESGSCCPDVSLLPDIAAFFGVSVDTLFGTKTKLSVNDLVPAIQTLFEESSKQEAFHISYQLAFLASMGVFTDRYQFNISKEAINRYLSEASARWGTSISNEPEGNVAVMGSGVFICDHSRHTHITETDIRTVGNTLSLLADKKLLKVFVTLYELTINDNDLFVSKEEIADECMLSPEIVEEALDRLPVETNQEESYRIEGSCMHWVPLLMMLR